MKYPEVKSPLVTVFQKIDNKKWIPIRRYRRFRVPYVEELIEQMDFKIGSPKGKGVSLSNIPCPGCGKTYSRLVINESHECVDSVGTPEDREEFQRQVQINKARIRMDGNSRMLLRRMLPYEEYERAVKEHNIILYKK